MSAAPASRLSAVLRAVEIRSPVSFSLAGAVHEVGAPAPPPRPPRPALRARVRLPAGPPTRDPAGGADQPRQTALRRERGQKPLVAGLAGPAIRPSGEIVARSGERERTAPPGEYAPTFAEDVPLVTGAPVTLLFPRESLTIQRGCYYAFGGIPEPDHERRALRVYLHAPQAEIAAIFAVLTGALDRAGTPFTLKTMLSPAEAQRVDATVLYLPRPAWPAVVPALREVAARVRLGRDVPLFTRRLSAGIGLAEHPSGRESFGMHRCRLVAEGIVGAWQAGRQDEDARLSAVADCFAAEGLSLAHPHLDAGSDGTYAPLDSAGRRFSPPP